MIGFPYLKLIYLTRRDPHLSTDHKWCARLYNILEPETIGDIPARSPASVDRIAAEGVVFASPTGSLVLTPAVLCAACSIVSRE